MMLLIASQGEDEYSPNFSVDAWERDRGRNSEPPGGEEGGWRGAQADVLFSEATAGGKVGVGKGGW